MSVHNEQETIIENILQSKKYKNVSRDLVEKIVKSEYGKYKSQKDLLKVCKKKLHQIFSLYKTESFSAANFLSRINESEPLDIPSICDEVLMKHVSTKERMPYYNIFYKKIFEVTGKPSSILDIACGMNPFAIYYIDTKITKYDAYDIDKENVDFINEFSKLTDNKIKAYATDVTQMCFDQKYDVGLVLKFLPVLESQSKGSSLGFLKKMNCDFIVASFPIKSIGGKEKGMEVFYTTRFRDAIKNEYLIINEIKYDNEMVFIIKEI
ncbi:hypothetical protein ISD58_31010 [Pseudomonas aeruginosa]|nr:hypothetical protein [Pseudomonas aeruginosa]